MSCATHVVRDACEDSRPSRARNAVHAAGAMLLLVAPFAVVGCGGPASHGEIVAGKTGNEQTTASAPQQANTESYEQQQQRERERKRTTWNVFIEMSGTGAIDLNGLNLRTLRRRFGEPDSHVVRQPNLKKISMWWGCIQPGEPSTCGVTAEFYEPDAQGGRVPENAVPVELALRELHDGVDVLQPLKVSIAGLRLGDPVEKAIAVRRRQGAEIAETDLVFGDVQFHRDWRIAWHASSRKIVSLTLGNTDYMQIPR